MSECCMPMLLVDARPSMIASSSLYPCIILIPCMHDSAADDIYDDVYDDIYDDIYDDVYDDFYDVYDGIMI